MERLDPKFIIQGGHQYLSGVRTGTLGSLVAREPDYGAPCRAVPREAGEIKYIRVTDFDDFGIPEGHRFVTAETVKDRFILEDGDMLFARSGATAGKTFLYRKELGPALFAGYCIRFRFDTRLILPDFVYLYSKTDRYAAWVRSMQRPSGQPNINKEEFKSFTIPLLDIAEQSRLAATLGTALAARREKLSQADALLASLNGFVLDALGLTLPPSDGRMVYAVRLRDASTRFDPDYNSPRFRTLRDKIKHGAIPAQSVGSLFYPIVSGFAAGRDDQTDDPALGVPHIRPLNITNTAELTFEGTKMVPRSAVVPGDFLKQGELLFNNTNSTAWVGKSLVFDADRDCACSNHITRLTLIDKRHSPYYFAAFFNALRGLGFFGLLSTNFNNQAGINVETLKSVRVPVPDPKDQQKIADEVASRREEARRLRDEARSVWDDAKRSFEEELLGPEPSAEESKTGNTKGGRNQ
ncbi:MAG: restriction endonuclease subunit S [Deltaproteobacteria bacterium]|nr:restriction endonuclease subunit S [Deltaproteobacteria bacterium]